MWKFSTYSEDSKVLESTISWFLIELNQLQTEYYFPPNTKPDSKYYLEKYFKKQHIVIRQPASLYLDYFIEIAYIVLIPRVFPRPYHTIYQTSSIRTMCWTHWFHHHVTSSLHKSIVKCYSHNFASPPAVVPHPLPPCFILPHLQSHYHHTCFYLYVTSLYPTPI